MNLALLVYSTSSSCGMSTHLWKTMQPSLAGTQSWKQEAKVRENQREKSLNFHRGDLTLPSLIEIYPCCTRLTLKFNLLCSLYAMAIQLNLLLTSTTVVRLDLMISQITLISKEFSVIFLFVKVFNIYLSRPTFPFSFQLRVFLSRTLILCLHLPILCQVFNLTMYSIGLF